MGSEGWIEEINRRGVLEVAHDLGLTTRPPKNSNGGQVGPCPGCHKERRHGGRSDKRLAIGVRSEGQGWHCFECDAKGDTLGLVCFALGGEPLYRDLADPQKEQVRDWCERFCGLVPGGVPKANKWTGVKPQKSEPPPAEEIRALWDASLPVDKDRSVAGLLRRRHAPLDRVRDRDLARVVPQGHAVPPWGCFERRSGPASWPSVGLYLLFGLLDHEGVLRQVIFRRVGDAKKSAKKNEWPPKTMSAKGARSGLLLACARSRAWLRGEGPAPRRVVVAEGEMDWLRLAAFWGDDEEAPHILGMYSGGWTAELAARVPNGCEVLCAQDGDDEGDKYARIVAASLRGRPVPVKRCPLPRGKDIGDLSDEEVRRVLSGAKPMLARIEGGGGQRTRTKKGRPRKAAPEVIPMVQAVTVQQDKSGGKYTTGAPLTDLGNAERLAALYADDLRWSNERGSWLCWDGKRWKWDPLGADPAACSVARSIRLEAQRSSGKDEKAALFKHAEDSESGRAQAAMVKLARSMLKVRLEDLDAHPWLLNLDNGILNLETGKFGPHESKYLLTKLAPVAYDPEAKCPRWECFLEQVLGETDPELVPFVARAVGYALTGKIAEHVLFFLHGDGRNGKGVFLNTISKVLGDYAGKAPDDLLIAKRQESHPTDLASIMGRRMVIASEVKVRSTFDEQRVKSLTGGDPITARFMHQDFFTFSPTFKLFVAANNKPKVLDTKQAFWDRMRLIPFTVYIPEEKRELDLEERLWRDEAPGILAWAVRGCAAWREHGVAAPESVMKATREYQEGSDELGLFFAERCVLSKDIPGVDYREKRSDLHKAYKAWAEAAGLRPDGRNAFFESMRGRPPTDGITEHRSASAGWQFVGIRLAHEHELEGRKSEETAAGEMTEKVSSHDRSKIETDTGKASDNGGLRRDVTEMKVSADKKPPIGETNGGWVPLYPDSPPSSSNARYVDENCHNYHSDEEAPENKGDSECHSSDQNHHPLTEKVSSEGASDKPEDDSRHIIDGIDSRDFQDDDDDWGRGGST